MNLLYAALPNKMQSVFNLMTNGGKSPLQFVKIEVIDIKTDDNNREGVRIYFTADEDTLKKYTKQYNTPLVDGCYIVLEAARI